MTNGSRFVQQWRCGTSSIRLLANLPSSDEDDGSKPQVRTQNVYGHSALCQRTRFLLKNQWKKFKIHWNNWKTSKARDSQKEIDRLGKNAENHGARCFGGPSVPGMLADVVGRVVPRPAVECCESGGKVSRQLMTTFEDHAIQRLDRIWPNRIWPKISEFGQCVFVTAFGQTEFGQN